jgi:heat shock protein HslJ
MKNMWTWSACSAVLLFAPICAASAQSPAKNTTQQPTISSLPATFVGTLPCADCPGIQYQVNLLSDHTFASRMTYQERNTSFDDHGHWQLAEGGKTLVLQGARGAKQQFALHDAGTLRQLDASGHEINSQLNYDLKRASTFESLAPQTKDAANLSLENTYWKLTSLGTTPVPASSGPRDPHLTLNSANHRVSGSGGCNQLAGSYQLQGDHLKFGQMASTMMACASGMDTEREFTQALDQATTWKITHQNLELFDSSGKLLARLEASQMK